MLPMRETAPLCGVGEGKDIDGKELVVQCPVAPST